MTPTLDRSLNTYKVPHLGPLFVVKGVRVVTFFLEIHGPDVPRNNMSGYRATVRSCFHSFLDRGRHLLPKINTHYYVVGLHNPLQSIKHYFYYGKNRQLCSTFIIVIVIGRIRNS